MRAHLLGTAWMMALGAVLACSSSSSTRGDGGDEGGNSATDSGSSSGSGSGATSGNSSGGSSGTSGGSSSGGTSNGASSGSSSGTSGGSSSGSSGSSASSSGSSSGTYDAGSEGGTDGPTDAPTEGATDAALCTPLDLSVIPTSARVTLSTLPFPGGAATGGTPVSGTYYASQEDIYQGGSASNWFKKEFVFDATNMQVREIDNGSSAPQTQYFTYSVSGSTLNLTAACGGSGAMALSFTVQSSTSLTSLFIYDSTNGRVDIFDKL